MKYLVRDSKASLVMEHELEIDPIPLFKTNKHSVIKTPTGRILVKVQVVSE
jgi:hypothetical protein